MTLTRAAVGLPAESRIVTASTPPGPTTATPESEEDTDPSPTVPPEPPAGPPSDSGRASAGVPAPSPGAEPELLPAQPARKTMTASRLFDTDTICVACPEKV